METPPAAGEEATADAVAAAVARGRVGVLALLRSNRDFRLLFFAAVISFGGDWFLYVALTGLVYSLTHSAALVGILFAALTVPFALFTFVGGPLADRFDRQKLMVTADLIRGVLALGFFFIHRSSQVWIVYVLAAGIAALGAVFEPASNASLPNLVSAEELPTAAVVFGATWGTMLAVGSALGGLVVAAFGRKAGYAGDFVSFLASAVLVLAIRRSFSVRREERVERTTLRAANREVLTYARGDRRVLAMLTVKGGFGLVSGLVGILPLLALQTFRAGDRGTGILLGFRGVGVFLGPFLIRRALKRDDIRALFWIIPGAFAVYGAFYMAAPWMPTIWLAGLLILGAHLGGGAQWTLSTYALQLIVPDHIRGRVFAFDYGLVTFTIAASATVAGVAASHFGVRTVIFVMACLALAYSVIWTLATANIRRSLSASNTSTPNAPPTL